MTPDPKLQIAPELQIRLCRQISIHRRRQELLLDTIADSVLLAAQQVQDKQVELLKMPARFTMGDAIMEILLSFVPFGSLAGAALSTFLSNAMSHILRTRVAFAIFSKSDLGLWLEGATKTSINNIRKDMSLNDFDKGLQIFGVRQTQGDLLNTEDVRVFYSDFVQKLTNGTALITNVKRIGTSLGKVFHSELRAGDTPGVAVCDMAMSFARQQKAAQNLVCDQLTLETQFNILTPEAAEKCCEFFLKANQHLDRTLTDLTAVRLCSNRVFEMVIWHRIYPAVTYVFNGGKPYLKFGTVPIETLSQYFVHRFFIPSKNMTYHEAYGTEAVLQLSKDWKDLSNKLDDCAIKVSKAFTKQVL